MLNISNLLDSFFLVNVDTSLFLTNLQYNLCVYKYRGTLKLQSTHLHYLH